MARISSEKVGQGPCPSCGAPVWFRRSAGGMLSHKCEACDSSGYAEPQGRAYRERMASLTPINPEPAPKVEPAPPPAPPQRRPARSAFDLGALS